MQTEVEDCVHHKEEDPEDEDRDNDYRCRGLHFLPRGRNHLAHLRAHIGQKPGKLPPLIGHAAEELPTRARARTLYRRRTLFAVNDCCLGSHTSSSFVPSVLPGAL